jgi:hypothetical protein
MLSAADELYEDVAELISCDSQPANLLYRFRRVMAAGMHLLSEQNVRKCPVLHARARKEPPSFCKCPVLRG